MAVKRGLGKGLGALIDSVAEAGDAQSGVTELDINLIEPNANQPRKTFHEDKLAELAESIEKFGVIQPIVVKKEDGYYSIIAGERRWRAARLARLKTIPVVVKDYIGAAVLEAALIENIQRADLNPVEEAACYRRLMDDYGLTQEELAGRVGKSRTHISSLSRLLQLDNRVQSFVSEGRLSLGHVKPMMSLNGAEQFQLAEAVIEEGLSVRQTEKLAEAARKRVDTPEPEKPARSVAYKQLEEELMAWLKTRVAIKGEERGKIEISFFSPEDLDRLTLLIKSQY